MVYTSEKNKRLNSIRDCDPICKPSSPLDKSSQAGKSLIVSRAHPTHCCFCNTRHASISCPSLDPVSGSIPRPTTTADISSLPPSKCRDCQVVDSSTTSSVVDGILQIVTTKKIVLCATHQAEDTAPPPLPAHTAPDQGCQVTWKTWKNLENGKNAKFDLEKP